MILFAADVFRFRRYSGIQMTRWKGRETKTHEEVKMMWIWIMLAIAIWLVSGCIVAFYVGPMLRRRVRRDYPIVDDNSE